MGEVPSSILSSNKKYLLIFFLNVWLKLFVSAICIVVLLLDKNPSNTTLCYLDQFDDDLLDQGLKSGLLCNLMNQTNLYIGEGPLSIFDFIDWLGSC